MRPSSRAVIWVLRALLCLAVGLACALAITPRSSRAQDTRVRDSQDVDRAPSKDEGLDSNDEPALRAQSSSPAVVEGFDLNGEAARRFTGPAWSLVYPDRDYQGGCVIGFLAFRFSPTGYFVYNNRVRGSWRVDELGNLLLRTKDGLKFTLIVEGNILRPIGELPFARRFYQFQRCPA